MDYEITVSNDFIPATKFVAKSVKSEQEALAYARSKLKETLNSVGVHPSKMQTALDECMKGAKTRLLS